jgi:uncharacterized protein YigA (DUF484 family)
MTTSAAMTDETPTMTKEMVIDYLREHPNFITENPEVLDLLMPEERNHGRGVIDFQFHAMDNLRSNMKRFEERFRKLVVSAQDNMSTQHQVHQASLSIMKAGTIQQLLEALTSDLMHWFDVDVVRLCLESEMAGLYDTYYSEANYSGICFAPRGVVNAALLQDDIRLIGDTQEQPPIGFEMIFADCSSLVRSCALLRLSMPEMGQEAILAFGVRKTGHFDPLQAKDLLQYLARVTGIKLQDCLKREEL